MPDSGTGRTRSRARTLVSDILSSVQWRPADNPRDAMATARDARDLAVRLRPVLTRLAGQTRSEQRQNGEWLPAVEQLAVDAQYFASWWLPRLEGKWPESWPSWSADGYADWIRRLDAQREQTLDMVRGAEAAGLASVGRPEARKQVVQEPAAMKPLHLVYPPPSRGTAEGRAEP
jgi:hypothetical protein